MEACTIHRLLGTPRQSTRSDAEDDESVEAMRFFHHKNNPLPGTRFLVDEASMLDVQLAGALLDALPLTDPRLQLILVGDVDQLPPVGPGSVLQHVIASGKVPVVNMREVFRQARGSRIVQSAHAVNAGRVPQLLATSTSLDHPSLAALLQPQLAPPEAVPTDAVWVRLSQQGRDNGAEVAAAVKDVVNALGNMGVHVQHDVQVLAPTKAGEGGTWRLNQHLQQLLNPPGRGGAVLERKGVGRNGAMRVLLVDCVVWWTLRLLQMPCWVCTAAHGFQVVHPRCVWAIACCKRKTTRLLRCTTATSGMPCICTAALATCL